MTRPPSITVNELNALPAISHGFFGRAGGISTGLYKSLNAAPQSHDAVESVRENRQRVADAIGAVAMVSANQVHGTNVVTVVAPWTEDHQPNGDGLVTDQPGIALCILTADCVPVLFADETKPIVGAAHAGWKGALGGVCEATLAAMVALGSRPEDIIAATGPSIQHESYEVGPEFAARFLADDPENDMYFRPGKADRLHFDLTRYIHRRLRRTGIGHVARIYHDTFSGEMYFSNRRRTHHGEPDYGRNASVITINQ
ncbi:MAG: peptidoglycan editing factor PgeF [Pseudomonadota bacterium]